MIIIFLNKKNIYIKLKLNFFVSRIAYKIKTKCLPSVCFSLESDWVWFCFLSANDKSFDFVRLIHVFLEKRIDRDVKNGWGLGLVFTYSKVFKSF